MNLSAGEEETDIENRPVHTAGEGENGTSWESSTDIYTPPSVKQTARGRFCETLGAWGSVGTSRGGMWGWEGSSEAGDVCTRTADSQCCTAETQNCEVIILQLKNCFLQIT